MGKLCGCKKHRSDIGHLLPPPPLPSLIPLPSSSFGYNRPVVKTDVFAFRRKVVTSSRLEIFAFRPVRRKARTRATLLFAARFGENVAACEISGPAAVGYEPAET